MNLLQPLLLREIACAYSGAAIIEATPLRFVPIHSSAPPSPRVRRKAEVALHPSANPSVPSDSAWQPQ